MATATKLLLRSLRDLLQQELGEDRPGGALADVFERFDGEPADAIDEHVAELRGEAGASVLVGFVSDDVTDQDETGVTLSAVLRPAILVVRRRDAKRNGASQATADAEALDDLYDAAALAADEAGWSVRRGRTLAGDTRDWIGRAIVAERERPFPPEVA